MYNNVTSQKRSPVQIMSGIFFIVSGVLSFILYMIYNSHGFHLPVSEYLDIIISLLLGATVFIGKKEISAVGEILFSVLYLYYIYTFLRYGGRTIWVLSNLALTIGSIIAAIMLFMSKDGKRNPLNSVWFLPAAFVLLGYLRSIINNMRYFFDDFLDYGFDEPHILVSFLWIFVDVTFIAGTLTICMWAKGKNFKGNNSPAIPYGAPNMPPYAAAPYQNAPVQPNYNQPPMGQPNYNQPNYGQNFSQPNFGQPNYSQPVQNIPMYGQPANTNPNPINPTINSQVPNSPDKAPGDTQ